MDLENPFFRREALLLARRPRSRVAIWIFLAGVALMAAPVLAEPFLRLQDGRKASQDGLLLAAVLHGVLCLVAGAYAAELVLADDRRQSALDELRLLPYLPAKWLALKLAFPLLLTLLIWMVGLPFYLAAVLLGSLPLSAAYRVAGYPLLVGLAMLAGSLLLPAGPATPQPVGRRGPSQSQMDREGWIGMLLLQLMGCCVMGWMARAWLGRLGASRPFYGLWLPEGPLWTMMAAGFLAAAFMSAMSVLSSTDAADRRVARVRVLVLLGVGFLAYGYAWGWLTMPLRWGIGIGFLLLVLAPRLFLPPPGCVRSTRPGPPDDPRSAAEVAQAAAWWENPVWVRDLRALSRKASVRKLILGEGWILPLLMLVPSLAFYWLGASRLTDLPHALGYGVALFGPTLLIVGPASVASARWERERLENTLAPLLLTPLSSEDLLRGRMAACLGYYWASRIPLLGVSLGTIIWSSTNGFWSLAPALFAVAPLFVHWALGGGVNVGKLAKSEEIRRNTRRLLLLCVGQAASVGCSVLILLAAPGRLWPAGAWGVALALFLLNWWTARERFRLWVRQLECLRHSDLELEAASPQPVRARPGKEIADAA